MRLLDLRDWDLESEQSWSLRLVSVDSAKSKDYAILSHTWESNGETSHELTYQDLLNIEQDDLASRKPGYAKCIQACLQTKKDGYDFVWIDTCCINKDSSSELSEAINSMWQWYYNAAVCYVYLFDFHSTPTKPKDQEQISEHKNLSQSFAKCRWFRRGWTLQELLAPRQIKFFGPHDNGRWKLLTEKSKVESLISELTGIDLIALQDRDSLFELVAARKFSWAAHRKTRYVEDRAYSLFGLFGVNMPLLYGEGDKAFIRLQEELIKTSIDHSVFAWEPSPAEPSPKNLLFATSPDRYCPLGRRMVTWGDDAAHDAFHLTNRGVTFMTVSVPESGEFMMLNCCLEDDFSGVVALPIEIDRQYQNTHGRRSFIRKTESLRIKPLAPAMQDVTLLRYRSSLDSGKARRQLVMPGIPYILRRQAMYPQGHF